MRSNWHPGEGDCGFVAAVLEHGLISISPRYLIFSGFRALAPTLCSHYGHFVEPSKTTLHRRDRAARKLS